MDARILTRAERDAYLARCVQDGDCLIWHGSVNTGGYAQVKLGGAHYLLRRLIVESRARRVIGPGKRVQSLCGRPACCEPAHLAISTSSDINRASFASGRRSHAVCVAAGRRARLAGGGVKLTMEDARAIRADTVSTRAELARRYNVRPNYITSIRSGRAWAETAANASVFSWRGVA